MPTLLASRRAPARQAGRASARVLLGALGTAACAALLLVPGLGCGGGDDDAASGEPAGEAPVMITPYVLEADMASVNEAFSLGAASPWGFEHNGIDFFPVGDMKPFQAVAAGTIEEVELWHNGGSGNWQVNVVLRVNDAYEIVYAFEPMTGNAADGQLQLGQIDVSVGQAVSPGDVIGRLHSSPGPGAHVHFHLTHAHTPICPEPHFTQAARASVLALLHVAHPGAAMCYE